MMLFGEGVRGVRPWAVTNEGDVWLTHNRRDGAIYAFVRLDPIPSFRVTESRAFAGKKITLKSVRATPRTKVTLLSQAGNLKWTQDEQGLHIDVLRNHTVQLVRARAAAEKTESGGEQTILTWGPDLPVAIKITNAGPAPLEEK